MHNNLYTPNTSPIPNILFDYWMAKLTPAEFKVLMAIARKTYGWHKQKDRISLRQLTELTGLHKSGVIKATEKLLELNLVIKFKFKDEFDGSDAPNQYEINTDFGLEGVEKNEGGCLHSRQGVVDSVDRGGVYTVDTQKKLYTKETLQNNKPPIPPEGGSAAGAAVVRKKKDFTDEVRETTHSMIHAMLATKPNCKTPKNISTIMESVHSMITEDSRTPEKILQVFEWALQDEFWSDKMYNSNPAKYLRGRFDSFEMKMGIKPKEKERKFLPSSNDEEAYRIAKEMKARGI